MRKLMRLAGLAMVLVGISLVLAGASGASNHAVFNDAIGDDSGGLAPDVTALDVTTTDDGGVALRVSINEPNGTFYVGDTVALLVDTDMNASTGDTDPARAAYAGSEVEIFASGIRDAAGKGVLRYQLCVFTSGAFGCADIDPANVKHEKTGTNSHAVTFSLTQGDWFTVGMRIIAFYVDPNDSSRFWIDRAPDSGLYPYDAKADPDGDRVAGTSDECPKTQGGTLDKDRDGCPPFLPAPKFNFVASPAGGALLFRSIRMSNAGPATVTARIGGLTVHRRGSGPLPRVAGRRLPVGALATFIYTSRNYFGSYKVARVTRSGFQTVRTGCTPPGKAVLMSCDKVKQ
jgi:hypothetical protein